MTVYDVRVERADRYWLVHVPQVERTTQARSLREVSVMARDLIVLMSEKGLDPEGIDLAIDVQLPESVRRHIARASELREQETQVRQEAAREQRAAVRELAEQGLTVRDIGTALGFSFQRAQQLINA